jgi:hypothetical protein
MSTEIFEIQLIQGRVMEACPGAAIVTVKSKEEKKKKRQTGKIKSLMKIREEEDHGKKEDE